MILKGRKQFFRFKSERKNFRFETYTKKFLGSELSRKGARFFLVLTVDFSMQL